MAVDHEWEKDLMANQFAKVVGIVLLLTGIVGLFAGEKLGPLNIELVEDIVHLATGAIFAYAGFMAPRDTARSIVMGLGVVYVLVGVLGFVDESLFGLLDVGYTVSDNILHLVIGAASLFVAMSDRRDSTTARA